MTTGRAGECAVPVIFEIQIFQFQGHKFNFKLLQLEFSILYLAYMYSVYFGKVAGNLSN